MHKMCQIPHPHRRLRPMSPLLDLATLTTAQGQTQGHVQPSSTISATDDRHAQTRICIRLRTVYHRCSVHSYPL